MNTCAPFQERLSDYFDGRMGPADPARAGLEAHLAGCPACAGMLRDFSLLREAVRPRGASVADPAAFSRGLRLRIRAGSRRAWWRPAAMAAGVALAIGGSWALHAARPSPPSPLPAHTPPPIHAAPPGHIPPPIQAPPGWTLVGEAGPATLDEMAETQDLSDLVEDLRLIRGGRTDRTAIYREIASVHDLAVNGPILQEVSYAP